MEMKWVALNGHGLFLGVAEGTFGRNIVECQQMRNAISFDTREELQEELDGLELAGLLCQEDASEYWPIEVPSLFLD